MRRLSATIPALAATTLFGAPAFSHHSQAMFDASREIVIEGTVARFDWVNPHMYLIVATEGPDGEPALANTRILKLTPAESLEGRWAPARQALGAAFGAMARWPVTPEGRAAQAEMVADGLCSAEPTPFVSILDEVREIEIGEDEVIIRFDNTGDRVTRTIRMNAEHPADVQPSHQGHAIGWWEGETLVIDTIAFEPDPSGVAGNVPSSPGKHTVERLTLTEDRTRLRYEVTVEDPVYLSEPATLTQQWDHRPDLEFAPGSEACDDDVAARYRDHVPE
jgi:hypothetical protein